MQKIKCALCDDDRSSYLIYTTKLRDIEAIEFIGFCSTAADAPAMIQKHNPDILLLDIQIESSSAGIDIIPALKAVKPDLKIIILTSYDYDEYIYQAFANGADSYLLKDVSSADQIAATISSVYNNTSSIPSHIAKRLANRTKNVETSMRSLLYVIEIASKLSATEYDILKDVYNGESYDEISAKRFISNSTMRNHISHILKKFNYPSMKHLLPMLRELRIFDYLK